MRVSEELSHHGALKPVDNAVIVPPESLGETVRRNVTNDVNLHGMKESSLGTVVAICTVYDCTATYSNCSSVYIACNADLVSFFLSS